MRLRNGVLSRQAFILREFLIDPSRYLVASLTRATTILTSAELCPVEHSASCRSTPPPTSTVRRRFCFSSAFLHWPQ
jgi:hypothetical protein